MITTAMKANKITADELTKDKIRNDIEKEQYEEAIKKEISYAVKEGLLDWKTAEEMSIEDMEDWINWSNSCPA